MTTHLQSHATDLHGMHTERGLRPDSKLTIFRRHPVTVTVRRLLSIAFVY
ncbi:hypothetical protein RMSM_00662 [Rhodopirellula maiorica SM1]|uniref:Uncharacterized protein n=1 Tax=Rhodopirellula maiorica SM1 TaxID=1265738 RepID=M5S447_9BACT|nr:hypothetical protein RMSM_00662 [Rhodopirellula maiorica SM1]